MKPEKKDIIDKQIKKLLKWGAIEPSSSTASIIILVL